MSLTVEETANLAPGSSGRAPLERAEPAPQLWLGSRVVPPISGEASKFSGLEMAGTCQPAGVVGGDFYDVVPVGQEAVLCIIADVMGKGVAASLFAARLRAHLRAMLPWSHQPTELLARANGLMFEELYQADLFITAQIVLMEPKRRRATVANAGHCPLLVAQPKGSARAIAPSGLPLGIQEQADFGEESFGLAPAGAGMLLYTDGITEVRNPEGDFFGQGRLEASLVKGLSRCAGAMRLRDHLLGELTAFQAGAPATDDRSLLAVVM